MTEPNTTRDDVLVRIHEILEDTYICHQIRGDIIETIRAAKWRIEAQQKELARVRSELEEMAKDYTELKTEHNQLNQDCIDAGKELARVREALKFANSETDFAMDAFNRKNEENTKLREELESAHNIVDAGREVIRLLHGKEPPFSNIDAKRVALLNLENALGRFGGRE
jgi:chromosome segregation ATPase